MAKKPPVARSEPKAGVVRRSGTTAKPNLKAGGEGPPVPALIPDRPSLKSVRDVLGSLKKNGSLDEVRERLASFDERQRAVAKDYYDALEARYR